MLGTLASPLSSQEGADPNARSTAQRRDRAPPHHPTWPAHPPHRELPSDPLHDLLNAGRLIEQPPRERRPLELSLVSAGHAGLRAGACAARLIGHLSGNLRQLLPDELAPLFRMLARPARSPDAASQHFRQSTSNCVDSPRGQHIPLSSDKQHLVHHDRLITALSATAT